MTGRAGSVPLIIRVAVPWLGAVLIAVLAGRIGGPVAALAGGLVTVGLALAAIRLLGRQDWRAAGLLPGRTAGRQLLLGFLSWLLPCAVMIIVGAAAGWLRFAADLTPAVLGVVGTQLLLPCWLRRCRRS